VVAARELDGNRIRGKIAKYPRPARRLFRGLQLVLEECERRGLAYWEASDVTDIRHPIALPEHLRAPWLEQVPFPRKGTWELIANVAAPGRPPLCAFDFSGLENFLTERPASAIADLATWPPSWSTRDESIEHCDRGLDGRWIVVCARESDGTWRSAPRVVEWRERIDAGGAVIDMPMTPGTLALWQGYFGDHAPPSKMAPVVDFVASIGGVGVVALRTGSVDEKAYPHRPFVFRDGILVEVTELPSTELPFPLRATIRLPDGGEVLVWLDRGYELVNGRLVATFVLELPDGWMVMHNGTAAVGANAILVQAFPSHPPPDGASTSALYLYRRHGPPRQVAPAVENLLEFSPGPSGSVLARLGGHNPKHLGCLLWPEQPPGGTVLWFDDDLFPDEDSDDIQSIFFPRRPDG
jgi:hypothetical protein